MRKKIPAICLCFLLLACSHKETKTEVQNNETRSVPEKIQFPSSDSLLVTANLYHKNDTAPVIVLCHQARLGKYEYVGIAKTLWEKGFTCLAVDQRSGGGLIEEFNETNIEAKKRNKPVDFLDAEKDIVATVNYMAKKYNKPVILWGSSYSSALALHVACDNQNVKAVMAFSPGDYFEKEKGLLKEKLIAFKKPMFVTSSKEESKELSQMLSKMKMSSEQTQFIPDSAGLHGSAALWKTSKNNEEYWEAVNDFLGKINLNLHSHN